MCTRHGWCGCGGPSTGPTACVVASQGLRAVGVVGGLPWGGGALRRCEGRFRSRARQPPAARHQGGLLGPAAHVLWARVCGQGGSALSPWLACPAGGYVPGGLREAVPGGGWPSPVVRGARCQALSLSRPPVPRGGRGILSPLSVCPGYRWCGPHCVRSCEPALRAVGVAGGRPRGGGGVLRRFDGRLRSGARPHPAARPRCGLSASPAHVLWARVCGRGGLALSCWRACPVGGLRAAEVGGWPFLGGGLPPL